MRECFFGVRVNMWWWCFEYFVDEGSSVCVYYVSVDCLHVVFYCVFGGVLR